MQISPITSSFHSNCAPSSNRCQNQRQQANSYCTPSQSLSFQGVNLTSVAKSQSANTKSVLKTGGAIVALALAIGSFVDNLQNRVGGIMASNSLPELKNQKVETSPLDTQLGCHQG